MDDLQSVLEKAGIADIDAALARFEAEERERLGLPKLNPARHWHDPLPSDFVARQRPHTTLLLGGLTLLQDRLIEAALEGLGYRARALDVPDNKALRFGKEYGNRGQCNPTWFTVGNLIKHLVRMRDEEGISTERIIADYVFVTAGACGPCRFGSYVTEYRKALRDADFDGFRVLLFQQTGGFAQATGEEAGLRLDSAFFMALLKAVVSGDVLNALGYRIRPYERQAGATDAALERCRAWVADTLRRRKSLVPALMRCRRTLARIPVDRSRVCPRVAIIGEFWAMTTEGDGNYKLQRFLESEGAEVEVQLVTAWLLYMIWETRWDTEQRAGLSGLDAGRKGLAGVNVGRRLRLLRLAELALRAIFGSIAKLTGLSGYKLPDMEALAKAAQPYYDNHVRGGEGHMEVGKTILNLVHSKVNMTLSVKPFGCMPSSSVSDGVQTLVTELHPQAIFLPIETSGDGEVNVKSRIQMQLFKARRAAQAEVDLALAKHGMSSERFRARLRASAQGRALHYPPHVVGCASADLVYELARQGRWWKSLGALWQRMRGRPQERSLEKAEPVLQEVAG